MKNFFKNLAYTIVGIFIFGATITQGASVLFPYGGGTGTSSPASGVVFSVGGNNPFTTIATSSLGISALPASPNRSVQFNNATTSFGGTSDLVWSTNKEFVITGDPSTFIADTANVMVSLEYDPSYGYDNTGKYDNNARVYPYRIVGGIKYFSATYAEGVTVTADQGGTPYRAVFSWDAVVGADGYRVVLLNGGFPVVPASPSAPFNYDYYVDTVTNSLTDNADQTYVPFVDGIDNVPIGTDSPYDNLQVLGKSKFTGTSKFYDKLLIDTTGVATAASEALHVFQNAEIDGVLGVAGVTDANTFINVSKTIALVDGVENRGLNITMTGSPVADTTGDILGINLNVSAPAASGHTNGGLTGMVMNVTDSSNSTGAVVGANIAVSAAGSSASPSQMYGVFMFASKASAGNMSTLNGARIGVNVGAAGNVSEAYGGDFSLSQNSNNNVANLANARGGFFTLTLAGEGATTDGSAGYFKVNLSKGGSVVGTASSVALMKGELNVSGGFSPTNLYGLYLPNITGGATNYSIFTAGGQVYHGGAATTSMVIDTSSGTQGSCLKLKDADGTGFTYVSVNNGTLTATTTSCI